VVSLARKISRDAVGIFFGGTQSTPEREKEFALAGTAARESGICRSAKIRSAGFSRIPAIRQLLQQSQVCNETEVRLTAQKLKDALRFHS
jgi:hypothetical protein